MIENVTIGSAERAQGAVLHEADGHRFIWLGLVEEEGDESVQVNQYAIEDGGDVYLLDPGGVLAFAHVVSSLSRFVAMDQIKGLFYSHQDPDVSSGIALWMQVTNAQAYTSGLWARFLPHFGRFDLSRLTAIPDRGSRINFSGGRYMEFVPAHFLHSLANFSVYDSASRILFTGDIGASVFSGDKAYILCDELTPHLPHMEGFHKRYMASNKACRAWVKAVRRLNPVALAPQHGAIMRGNAVGQFLDWLERLECGVDLIDDLYGR